MHLSRTVPVLLLSLWILYLAGCSTGVRPTAPVLDVRVQEQARQLEASGDYPAAAAVYLRAAERAAPPLKEDYLLAAFDSLERGGEYARAALVIDGLTPGQLTESQQRHLNVAKARLALVDNLPGAALEILQQPPADGPYAAAYRELRGKALLALGDPAASAAEYLARNALLSDPAMRLENQLLTWEAVSALDDTQLQELRTAPPPDVFSGWLELVELTRLYLQQPDALADVIPHWQMRYPGHPASEQFLSELLGTMREAGQVPAQIALLLPLTGELAGAATAIRDGVLSAYYAAPEENGRPVIRVYDTGNDPLAVTGVYEQAVQDGARFVIGPLRKAAVDALLRQESLPVPVLALNQVEAPETGNAAVYQFGLAPEDEARAVALRAAQDGRRRALALVPEGDWGERVYAAFAEAWLGLGGTLLDHGSYNPSETDHGRIITALLNLDASKAREQRLARLLGQTLEFEPRRRQDVDFIFLLATPQQARLIRPQLSFFRASRVPVYATSHVYSGYPDPARDTDMNGLLFCDLPWMFTTGDNREFLKRAIDSQWPASARQYARFYALGIDALQVIPYLNQLEGGLFGAYQGVTGNLSLDSRRQIRRTLRWAQFRNGLPWLLDNAAVTDTSAP